MPPEEEQARATGNMQNNFVKFYNVVFQLCEGTDKQTYTLNTIL